MFWGSTDCHRSGQRARWCSYSTECCPHPLIGFSLARTRVSVSQGSAISGPFMIVVSSSLAALLLHDLGYDVWLGNSRGNSYSRTHLNLSSTSKSFWDFSWHEIGFYDLPAIIDTILRTTGVTRLDYVGHSQGVTSFLVMSTLRPEYQQYFRTVIAMSPIAFMSHIPNTYLRVLSSNLGRFEVLLDTFKIYEVTPSNGVRARLSSILCSETSPIRDLCANILFITVGPGPVYLNRVS